LKTSEGMRSFVHFFGLPGGTCTIYVVETMYLFFV
jgi:hypothetical protein